ncbi:MAG: hypothetical protein HZA22_05890 [Nitrospirae bacterium]|nr:hypothetical protein [Nitrospirota bacterium]
MNKAMLVGSMLLFFAVGYITGSIQTRNAMALELGNLGQTVSSLKSLGKTIVEMQENVDKLQKNIADARKVRDDLSTYQGVYDQVTGKGATQQGQPLGDKVSPELQRGINQLLAPAQKK